MNIFVTDYNPKVAAQNLCNIHLNKMIVETAQMLSTYIWSTHKPSLSYSAAKKEEYKQETRICVPCYINHPCNVWLRKDIKNVRWLHQHFSYLRHEYTFRTSKIHACNRYYDVFNDYLIPLFSFPIAPPDDFCLCMPDEFKTDDPVQSYRNYYIFKYTSSPRLRKYTNRREPQWLIDAIPSLIEY